MGAGRCVALKAVRPELMVGGATPCRQKFRYTSIGTVPYCTNQPPDREGLHPGQDTAEPVPRCLVRFLTPFEVRSGKHRFVPLVDYKPVP